MNMKKYLFPLLAVVCTLAFCTACSDDDDDKIVSPIQETISYADSNGLALTYNGKQLIGKMVTFVPDATQADKATLTLSGNFDLSSVMTREDLPVIGLGAGPGVLPGTAELTIPVTLKIVGDECSFQGSAESDYCTFNYSGRASKSALQLDLTEVALKNNRLANTIWTPAPYDKEGYTQEPIHIVWEAAKGIELFPGYEMPLQTLLSLIIRMPLIEAEGDQELSVNEMLNYVLRTVSFGADGNIGASYVDVAKGGTSALDAPYGVAQYVVLDDTHLKVFLNPTMIAAIAKQNAAATRSSLETVIAQLIPTVANLLTNGVPLEYRLSSQSMEVFLNTELLLPLLKAVASLLQDPELMATLVEQIKSDPDMADMADTIIGALQSLPAAIDSTTKIEVGLNLAELRVN